MQPIQIFSNTLGEEELEAVRKVFESKWLGIGKETEAFENEFAEKVGAKYALATNNCTSALFISIKTLDIGPGDEVIIPSIHFVGAANAIIDAGATPVFADVDPVYFNITASEIDRLRTKNTRAVMLLHYGGHPCDFDAIKDACGGLYIIEDSANSIVSTYKGKNCGTLGDIGCFSFDPMKMLVTGDGGMMTFNRESLYKKAKLLRYFGIVDQSSGLEAIKSGRSDWWEFDLGCISERYVPNDITSAIGRVQLKKLDGFIARRKEIWERYQTAIYDKHIALPPEPLCDTTSSYYLYWIRTSKRLEMAKRLFENNIYTTFRYFPLHLVKQYRSGERLPIAEEANKMALNLPLHQNLSDEDVDRIIKCLSI
jgi:dTDP-4-amino-4,6-dideoxygalactose transaminase